MNQKISILNWRTLLSILPIGGSEETAVQTTKPRPMWQPPSPDVERVIRRMTRDGNVEIWEEETIYRKPTAAIFPAAPALPAVHKPPPPQKLTSFKLVRVDEHGRFVSLAGLGNSAMPRVYRIGDTLQERALPEHGGGLYSYLMNPGQIIRSFVDGRVWDLHPGEYGVLETEVWPPFVGYTTDGRCLGYVDNPAGSGSKFAASQMRVVSCAARFGIQMYSTGYYAYEQRDVLRLITREVYGQPMNRVEDFYQGV